MLNFVEILGVLGYLGGNSKFQEILQFLRGMGNLILCNFMQKRMISCNFMQKKG